MRDNYIKKQKKKEFVAVLLICMVCLSTIIIGTSAFTKKNNKEQDTTKDIVNLNETTEQVADNEIDNGTDLSVNSQVNKQTTSDLDNKKFENTTNKTVEKNIEATTNSNAHSNNQVETEPITNASSPVDKLSFDSNTPISWPVNGNVILDFSMDKTVYFSTLDSYRCNPAIIIQSDNNIDVLSAAKGYVSKVGVDDEIGNYVVMSLGSGYEITYGQLRDICVNEGDMIDATQKIGNISSPTKYYTKEGYNLYLELTKDGVPVDPLDYIE